MVERSLGVREIPGSIPGSPKPPRPPLSVSFLFSRDPSGHSSAAASMQDALREIDPSARSSVINLCADVHPALGPLVAWSHLGLVRAAPRLWTLLYDEERAVKAVQKLCFPLRAWQRPRLRRLLAETRPDVIVCTQALACAALALEKAERRLST